MTLEQTATRLLAGSSPGFTQAVTERLRATTIDHATTADQHALDAATALVKLADRHNTDWHTHRAIEAIHHADWLWRHANRINQGPDMANIDTPAAAAETRHTNKDTA